MKKWIVDIREKTSDMNKKEAAEYILTYYWYHILIFVLLIGLLILFGLHYLFGNEKPEFTCVLLNQEIDTDRDNRLTEGFAALSGLSEEQIEIDSNYNFSYGDVQLSGVNESSYEKFFLRWRNEELDAVILPESLYEYCTEMGGTFRNLDGMDTGTLTLYTDEGVHTAVVLGNDRLTEEISGGEEELLLLAFPENGQHEEACRKFLSYIQEEEVCEEIVQ